MASKVEQIMTLLESTIKAAAPKDTWNLTNNGIRRVETALGPEIRMGGEVAPYGILLNESGMHKGWFDNAVESCMPTINNILKNNITEQEVNELIQKQKNILSDKLADHIARKERELNDIRTSV